MNGRTNVTGSGSNGSLGGVIPLEAPSNFTVTPDNGKCLLTWTDPKDKYADELGEITDEGDQLVSQFAHTRIVRKVGSVPSSPNDGDLVTKSSTRNQYQNTAYSDEGLVNNTTYYYAAFTCNTDGVWSGSVTGSATPKAYDPILANNSWEQINEVANEGIAASVWEIGDEHPITIIDIPGRMTDPPHTSELQCAILAFNDLNLADNSGKNAITFVFKNVCDVFEIVREYVPSPGYPTNGTWDETDVATLLCNKIISHIDPFVADILVEVTDYSCIGSVSSDRITTIQYNETAYNSKVIGFTPRELFGDTWPSELGYSGAYSVSVNDTYVNDGDTISNHGQYSYFATIGNRICHNDPYYNSQALSYMTTYRGYYYLTPPSYTSIYCSEKGKQTSGPSSTSFYYVCPGFCIGKTPS